MKDHKVDVFLDDRQVGTLAETSEHRVAFAYADSWLKNGFAISPFSLPLEQKVFVPTSESFQGLWGVFADSLPDAWGRLLVDRILRSRGLSAADVSVLDRLAIVGSSGMGALTIAPPGIFRGMPLLGIWTNWQPAAKRFCSRKKPPIWMRCFDWAGAAAARGPR